MYADMLMDEMLAGWPAVVGTVDGYHATVSTNSPVLREVTLPARDMIGGIPSTGTQGRLVYVRCLTGLRLIFDPNR